MNDEQKRAPVHHVSVAEPANMHMATGDEAMKMTEAIRAGEQNTAPRPAEPEQAQEPEPAITRNPDLRHTADMGEISGFGGGYEEACQDMLQTGIEFINNKKLAGSDLKAHTYQGIYGLFFADNNITQELEDAVVKAAPGCTGGMVQAVMSRLFYIANNGWDKYKAECTKAWAEERAEAANTDGAQGADEG